MKRELTLVIEQQKGKVVDVWFELNGKVVDITNYSESRFYDGTLAENIQELIEDE